MRQYEFTHAESDNTIDFADLVSSEKQVAFRTGVVAKKLGMTRIFDRDGRHVPVTVLSMRGAQIVGLRTVERDGYEAVVIGYGEKRAHRTAKPQRAEFAMHSVSPKQKLMEFRVRSVSGLNIGDEVLADHFHVGQKVDVSGVTIGKGFSGAMKRWNFGGLRASHGVSISHRSHGSTGQCQDPGRVFKGKKMAGQDGNNRRTVQNLEVVRTDVERGIILVKGSIPGSSGSFVKCTDAVKSGCRINKIFPGSFRTPDAGVSPRLIQNLGLKLEDRETTLRLLFAKSPNAKNVWRAGHLAHQILLKSDKERKPGEGRLSQAILNRIYSITLSEDELMRKTAQYVIAFHKSLDRIQKPNLRAPDGREREAADILADHVIKNPNSVAMEFDTVTMNRSNEQFSVELMIKILTQQSVPGDDQATYPLHAGFGKPEEIDLVASSAELTAQKVTLTETKPSYHEWKAELVFGEKPESDLLFLIDLGRSRLSTSIVPADHLIFDK